MEIDPPCTYCIIILYRNVSIHDIFQIYKFLQNKQNCKNYLSFFYIIQKMVKDIPTWNQGRFMKEERGSILTKNVYIFRNFDSKKHFKGV